MSFDPNHTYENVEKKKKEQVWERLTETENDRENRELYKVLMKFQQMMQRKQDEKK